MPTNGKDVYRAECSSQSGRVVITGTCHHCGIQFQFSLREQKNSRYLMRGRISLIDPKTGCVLEATGRERRKKVARMVKKGQSPEAAEQSETLKAVRSISLPYVPNDKQAKEIILKAAEELYGKYALQLCDVMRHLPPNMLRLSELYQMYGSHFLARLGTCSPKTYCRRDHDIASVAAALSKKTVNELQLSDVKSAAAKLHGDVAAKLRLTSKFWEFLVQRGDLQVSNPIYVYLKELRPAKTDPAALRRRAVTPKSLPDSVERELNDRIRKGDSSDRFLTGVLFVKEAGLTAREVCNLRCSNVKIDRSCDPPQVTICRQIDDLAGATHLYMCPISRFGAEEVCRRLGHDDEDGYVLADTERKPLQPAKLTSYCREILLECGMRHSDLEPNRAEPHGVGITLLLHNFRNRLSYFCGASLDQGALDYLCWKSLAGNTTADHYRSFSSPDGQKYLRALVQRDGRYDGKPYTPPPGQCFDGQIEETVTALEYDRLTAGEIDVVLMPGERVEIKCAHGWSGTVQARRVRKKRDADTTISAYSDDDGQLSLF